MKIYRDINGSFAFKDATMDEVKQVFGDFRFDEAKFDFSENVVVCDKTTGCAGFKISGKINEKFDDEQIKKLFGKLMKRDVDSVLCEIK